MLPLLSCAAGKGLVTGQRVLVRTDMNVPMDGTRIRDDTRIRTALPGLRLALGAGAGVLVCSHLGRPPEGGSASGHSLGPVAQRLGELLEQPVAFPAGSVPPPGQIAMMENCRLVPGERACEDGLSRRLAALCDIFVHDAFGVAHRNEASTCGVARAAPLACAGPLLAAEMAALARIFDSPRRPLAAIVGGAKVSTKLAVLEHLAERVDLLVTGGGIANTFMLASGMETGKSIAEPALAGQARRIMARMQERGAAIPLPVDVVTAPFFRPDAPATIKPAGAVGRQELILDIGPETADRLETLLKGAGTVVWNGPAGAFEFSAFGEGTRRIAMAVAATTGFSVAGGGDTLAAITLHGLADRIGYISTGGGAFLEFLAGRTLPGIAALMAHPAAARLASGTPPAGEHAPA